MLLAVLALLFWRSFLGDYVHFSNDGPLGQQNAAWRQLPEAMTGSWYDINDIGSPVGGAAPSVTSLVFYLFGPVGYAKIYQPLSLFILGLGAWTFFRSLKLSGLASTLGALAAMLNTTYFAGATWGVASVEIALGMNFFALALIGANRQETPWLARWTRYALAGMCVGMNVMEGADVGALCSVLVAIYAFYACLTEADGAVVSKVARGIGRVTVIAGFAGFLAVYTVVSLVSTQIQGIAGTAQDTQTKAQNWDKATQWSLPKTETLGLIVPGLFGYKMDTPKDMMPQFAKYYENGVYWGGVGRDPELDRFFDKIFQPGDEVALDVSAPNQPRHTVVLKVDEDGTVKAPGVGPIQAAGLSGSELMRTIDQAYANGNAQSIRASVALSSGFMRFTGGGDYLGILVCVLAVWAAIIAFPRKNSPFNHAQRLMIFFWLTVAVLSLFVAWGRFAPGSKTADGWLGYAFLYHFPYFSTMRNPCKFIIFFTWAVVVLFAYGLHALSRRNEENQKQSLAGPVEHFKNWWARALKIERRWVYGCLVALGASVLGWLIFSSQKAAFVQYLQQRGYGDEEMAQGIATFAISQVAWFIPLFAVAVALVLLAVSGYFAGKRAKLGAVLLSGFVLFDFGRANLPYVVHWDYKQKYEVGSLNPIIEFLAKKPYEYRVADLRSESTFEQLYRIEWMQHIFPYYNVQCLDIIQMPRMPEDLKTYLEALSPRGTMESAPLVARHWLLTNTRYLLGPAGYLSGINQQLDPGQQRFRIVQRFEVVPKPGIARPTRLEELTAVPADNGSYALFEFTGALPRAKLYGNWQVNTNDQENLKTLTDLSFDPAKTVLVSTPEPGLPMASTNENTGTVEFKSYSPKHIEFAADAKTPSVMLFNDKYDANWSVTVDGQPAPLLRCNYLMRGVYLQPGQHVVKFEFSMPSRPLYVTLAALGIAIFLSGLLVFLTKKKQAPASN